MEKVNLVTNYTVNEIYKLYKMITTNETETNRHLLLTGGIAVGKTFYSKVLACLLAETEFIAGELEPEKSGLYVCNYDDGRNISIVHDREITKDDARNNEIKNYSNDKVYVYYFKDGRINIDDLSFPQLNIFAINIKPQNNELKNSDGYLENGFSDFSELLKECFIKIRIRQLCNEIIKGNKKLSEEENICLINLTSNSSYNEIISGIKISTNDNKITYKNSEGILLDFINIAKNSSLNHIVILDDLSRCNISETLGDLLNAVESNDVGNQLTFRDEKISLPNNLYIIATYNPVIAKVGMDYAWMRRFNKYEITPNYDGKYIWEIGDDGLKYNFSIGEKSIDKKTEYFIEKYDITQDGLNNAKGKITRRGILNIRRVEWENYVFMVSEFKRYCLLENHNADQYIPGHGIFLTISLNKSYVENLFNCYIKLFSIISPLLHRYVDDGVLAREMNTAIETLHGLKDIISNKDYLEILKNINFRELLRELLDKESIKFPISADGLEKIIIQFIKTLPWPVVYLHIFRSISLYRVFYHDPGKCFFIEDYKNKFLVKSNGNQALYAQKDSAIILNDKKYRAISQANHKTDHVFTSGEDYSLQYYNLPEIQALTDLLNTDYTNKQTITENTKVSYSFIYEIIKANIKIVQWRQERIAQMRNVDSKMKIMDDLNIKQMILQGPPGTSKTYGAKHYIIKNAIYKSLISCGKNSIVDCDKKEKMQCNCKFRKENNSISKEKILEEYQINDYDKWEKNFGWDIVQFHPSYGYEDFVRGITVSTDKVSKTVLYKTVNKILGKMCELASKFECCPESKFFLIIDEINRADVATVFGELIYALEYRGEEVSVPYEINGSKIKIPKNLYIIGTMNTADKSIGSIDYAIRRRFLFFDCLPDSSELEKYYGEKNYDEAQILMENINNYIEDNIQKGYRAEHYYIGHTYFMSNKKNKPKDEFYVWDKKIMQDKIVYQIIPILREYYEDGILNFNNKGQEKLLIMPDELYNPEQLVNEDRWKRLTAKETSVEE